MPNTYPNAWLETFKVGDSQCIHLRKKRSMATDLKPCCSYTLSTLPGNGHGCFLFLFLQRLYALYPMTQSLGNASYNPLNFLRSSQQMWKHSFRKWTSIFVCCLRGTVWDGYRISLERVVYGPAGPSIHLCCLLWKHRRAQWPECCSESILILSQAHWEFTSECVLPKP